MALPIPADRPQLLDALNNLDAQGATVEEKRQFIKEVKNARPNVDFSERGEALRAQFTGLAGDFGKPKQPFVREEETFKVESDSPSQFAEGEMRGAGLVGGAVEGLEQAKEAIERRTGLIRQIEGKPLEKAVRGALNPVQAGLDLILGGVGGAVGGVAAPTVEDVIAKVPEEKREKIGQQIQDLTRKFEGLDPQVKEDIRSAVQLVDALGLGIGGRAAKEVGGEVIEQTGKAVARGIDIAEDIASTLSENAPDIASGLNKIATTTKLQGLNNVQAVKNTIAGIDKNLLPVIERADVQLAQEFLDVAKRFDTDIRSATPHDFAVQKMQEGFKTLQSKLQDEGSLIGKARQKVATVKTSPDDVQEVIDSILPVLEQKGYKVLDGKITPIKGREPQLLAGDVKEAQLIIDSLKRLKADPSFQRLLDNRMNIEKNIQFKKRAGEVSDGLDVISTKGREKLREILERQIGPLEADRVEAFAQLKNVMDEIAGATSKGQNISKFMNRLLSERGGVNKEIAVMFEEATGISPIELAVLTDISTKTIKNPKAISLLQQHMVAAAKKPGLIGKLDSLAGAIIDITKDVIVPLDKQLINIIKNKKSRDALIKRLSELSAE